ncbi:MAG TPA: RNA polymerase sigma factor [Tepidisphaeraceae bacterium]|jgi:RNA polymerase sigma-70 factor (ECF subfamily)
MTAKPMDNESEPIILSDETLMQQLRDGQAHAGQMLAARYALMLLRYLRSQVGSEHLAEELHQQTWISVLEHIDRFDPKSSPGGFKAWLFRIATNKAHDHWRSSGREKSAMTGIGLITDTAAPEAEQRLEGTEEMMKLRRAIDSLPENQKQVVMLKYYSGLKFVEIAEVIGCPLNTALGRMHKAVARLRQIMQEQPRQMTR